MDYQKFALRLVLLLSGLAIVVFWSEAAWDFFHAVDPATGQPLKLAELQVTPQMVRAVASTFARAYNNILALLLTFISLAIPLTANLYTPKLVEIFVRDKLNVSVLCIFALLAAHSIFVVTLSFDNWTPQLTFWVDGICAMVGWLLLLPYYFYVVSFIDPLTIIKRIHLSLVQELQDAVAGKYPIEVAQQRVNQRIVSLGNMLQRSLDRADRDVAFDAIKAHAMDLARLRAIKPRLPPEFFKVTSALMVGVSSDALAILNRDRTWMEHRGAGQLVLAFRTALQKLPEGVSALVHAFKNSAYDEAVHRNDAVFELLIRMFNTFLREAIKKKENAPVYVVVYNYKTLIRRLIVARPELVPPLVRHLRYYAEFARSHGLSFIYDLVSYELAEVTEVACERQATETAGELLAAILEFDGVEKSSGLVKSRAILAGYFALHDRQAELQQLESSLAGVPRPVLELARRDIEQTTEPVFWEISDRGINIDYVAEPKRAKVLEVFERLLAAEAARQKD